MLFPFGPLFDPAADQVNVTLTQRKIRIRRRHLPIRIAACNAPVNLAFGGNARFDHELPFLGLAQSSLFGVEAELGFSRLFIRAMTFPATIREQGTDLEIEIDL